MNHEPVHLSRLPIVTMLIIASVMVIVIGLLSFQNSDSRRTAARELNVSTQIREATDDLLSLLTDAETAQRGYLLTGKETYLEPYNRSRASIPAVLARLDSVTPPASGQAERVADLHPVVGAKLRELALTIDVRRSRGLDAALEIVDSGRGKALMDDIRARCAVIRNRSE